MSWFPQLAYLAISCVALVPPSTLPRDPIVDAREQELIDRQWYVVVAAVFTLMVSLAAAGGFYAKGFGWPQYAWTALVLILLGRKLSKKRPAVGDLDKRGWGYPVLVSLVALELGLLAAGGFFRINGVAT